MLLTACSNKEVKIKEDVKEAEPVKEERIVDLSGSTEEFLILGVTPVASGNIDMADHTKFAPLIQDQLKDTENLGWYHQEVDPELVSATLPDRIFISVKNEHMKEKYEKIAPVVVVPHMYFEFEERLRFIAKEINKEAKMEEWLTTYQEKAKDLQDKLATKTKDKTVMVMEATPKELRIYATAGLADILYHDIKLTPDPNTPEPDGWGGKIVSLEALSEINPDFIWLMRDNEKTVIDDLDLWEQLEVVKNNNVYTITSAQNYNESFTAIGREHLLQVIEEQMLP